MIHLTEEQAREVRSLAHRILDLVPDPDAIVHAQGTERRGLCRRSGKNPRLSSVPTEVTYKGCKTSSDWDAWAFRRSEEP